MSSAFSEKIAGFFGVKDRLGLALTVLSALLAAGSLAVVLWLVVSHWGQLVFLRLHYTVTLGIDWIADWRYIFVYPGLAAVVFLANGWLAGRLARRSRRLSRLAMVFTVFLLGLILVSSSLIVSLNG